MALEIFGFIFIRDFKTEKLSFAKTTLAYCVVTLGILGSIAIAFVQANKEKLKYDAMPVIGIGWFLHCLLILIFIISLNY